jgi:hypothetical protein
MDMNAYEERKIRGNKLLGFKVQELTRVYLSKLTKFPQDEISACQKDKQILRAQRTVGIVSWWKETHLWEALKLCELAEEAEQLHGDAGRDDEQAHREYDEAAQLLAWTKYLVHKIFQHWRCFDKTHYPQNLKL